jgi:hypothetical protein
MSSAADVDMEAVEEYIGLPPGRLEKMPSIKFYPGKSEGYKKEVPDVCSRRRFARQEARREAKEAYQKRVSTIPSTLICTRTRTSRIHAKRRWPDANVLLATSEQCIAANATRKLARAEARDTKREAYRLAMKQMIIPSYIRCKGEQ